jgi:hypothetical protein
MRLESGYTPRPYFGTGAGSLTADPQLQGITKSFGGGEAFNFNSGNKASGMFDPLTLGLGLGSSVISGLFGMGQAKTSASIAQAQLAAQNAAMLEGRQARYGQLAGAMFNKLFDAGTGSDLSFQREKDAKMFEVGPYAERLMGLKSEAAGRERRGAISPEAKERAQFENRLAIQRSIAEKRAATDAMFGPISSSYFA